MVCPYADESLFEIVYKKIHRSISLFNRNQFEKWNYDQKSFSEDEKLIKKNVRISSILTIYSSLNIQYIQLQRKIYFQLENMIKISYYYNQTNIIKTRQTKIRSLLYDTKKRKSNLSSQFIYFCVYFQKMFQIIHLCDFKPPV